MEDHTKKVKDFQIVILSPVANGKLQRSAMIRQLPIYERSDRSDQIDNEEIVITTPSVGQQVGEEKSSSNSVNKIATSCQMSTCHATISTVHPVQAKEAKEGETDENNNARLTATEKAKLRDGAREVADEVAKEETKEKTKAKAEEEAGVGSVSREPVRVATSPTIKATKRAATRKSAGVAVKEAAREEAEDDAAEDDAGAKVEPIRRPNFVCLTCGNQINLDDENWDGISGCCILELYY